MKIFLSHSRAQSEIAAELAVALEMEDHRVFVDKERLGAGEGYHATIRAEIASSDLFIFLVSPESVAQGRYALSELKLARQRWPNPEGQVLPVLVCPTPLETVPAYLRAVNILSPEGHVVAEVTAAVADLAASRAAAAARKPTDETEAAKPRPPEYRPVELVFRPGAEQAYPVELRDSPLGSMDAQSCRLDPSGLEAALSAGEADGEAVLRGASAGPTPDELRSVGASLYASLFESGLHPFLEGSLKSVDPQEGKGLRFLINTTDTPELARLPWEFLYSPGQDDFLFSRVLTPVVRWLDVKEPTPSLRVTLPLRVLVAVATPQDRPELRVGDEIAHLDGELAELTRQGLVDVVRLEHATLESLDRTLVQATPHILHFVGHGGFEGDDGVIILESEDAPGRSAPVRGGSLAVLLRNHLKSLRLVFLNSCLGAAASRHDPFGGVAQSLIRRGMPAVVAMQFPVIDRASVILARHFYRYLASGYPVDAALTSARAFLFAKGYEVEWGAPALYMRAPDGKLFDIPAAAAAATVAAIATPVEAAPVTEPPAPPPPPPTPVATPPPVEKGPGLELRMSRSVAMTALVVVLVAVLGVVWMLTNPGSGPDPVQLVTTTDAPPVPDRKELDRAVESAREAIADADGLISEVDRIDLNKDLRARLDESIEQRDRARTILDDEESLEIEDARRAEDLANQASGQLTAIRTDAETMRAQAEQLRNDRRLAAARERVREASRQEPPTTAAVDSALSSLSEDSDLAQAVGGDSGLASRLAAAVAILGTARDILAQAPKDAASIARAEGLANQASDEFAGIREDAGRLDRQVARERQRRQAEERRLAGALAVAAAAAHDEIARAEVQLAALNEELYAVEPVGIPPELVDRRDAAARDLVAARAQLASGEQARDIDAVRGAERKASEVLADLDRLGPMMIAAAAASVEEAVIVSSDFHGWTLRGQVGYTTGSGSEGDGTEAGNGPAVGVAFEKHFSRRVGLEVGLGYTELDLSFWQLTVGPTFHVTPDRRADLFVAPVIAVVHYDDIDPGAIDNDFTWGAEIGVDVSLSHSWGFHANVRYLDTTARTESGDFELDVKPVSLMVGFALRF